MPERPVPDPFARAVAVSVTVQSGQEARSGNLSPRPKGVCGLALAVKARGSSLESVDAGLV